MEGGTSLLGTGCWEVDSHNAHPVPNCSCSLGLGQSERWGAISWWWWGVVNPILCLPDMAWTESSLGEGSRSCSWKLSALL